MANSIATRVKRAWNVFMNRSPTASPDYGIGRPYRVDRRCSGRGNERSIVNSVFNRIALDVAATNIRHVKLDEKGRFTKEIDSGLNNCLSLEANIDQTGRAFMHDAVLSMFDEGSVAIVPVDTDDNPDATGSYRIETMRVGKILEWFPKAVKVELYNDNTGRKQEVVVPKSTVAIVENPLYTVMNEPNSTVQRLIRKLNLLDAIDEQSSAGKLDLIIQLPYTIKTQARRDQAEQRRVDIEKQLSGTKYGIAYVDGAEHVTQLNRPIENNLLKQIEYLLNMAYSQLGITQGILDGTANEETMLNYNNRSIEPIISAFADEYKRKFLTKTARTQGHSIAFFRDPFKLVPISKLAELGDKFIRNEILSANEVRQIIGIMPNDDPKSDELRNPNIRGLPGSPTVDPETVADSNSNEALDELDSFDDELDELEQELEHGDSDDELIHYASPYYDPVKAHEYYMKNRELKDRRSTAGLNDEGKQAARYVKEQLTTERKTKTDAHRDQTNSQINSQRESINRTIAQNRDQMRSKIDGLRDQLRSMTPEMRKQNKEKIYGIIDELREQNNGVRESLRNLFKQDSTALREEHKAVRKDLKTEYDEKYLKELDAIRGESKFQGKTRRRS